jgi:hypothetical protein
MGKAVKSAAIWTAFPMIVCAGGGGTGKGEGRAGVGQLATMPPSQVIVSPTVKAPAREHR